MAVPNNFLINVATYQQAELAFLQNLGCFIAISNKRYENFTTIKANLGAVVQFAKPPRMTTTDSLVAEWQPADQRFQSLAINKQVSASCAFTDQQVVENVKDYMQWFGKPAVVEIGTKIEANVALNCLTNTYRFYDGVTSPLNSPTQLAQALAQFRNYGAVNGEAKGVISDMVTPTIVGGGLSQFVMDRNEEYANTWELGTFSRCKWYMSNLLPSHIAGTVGSATSPNNTMTVDTCTFGGPNNSIDTITFTVTTTANDPNCIAQWDRLQFNDIAGTPLLRYLTFTGHQVSQNKVQIQAIAAAAATGSSVTVTINPPLQVLPTNDQNINTPIVAGMTVTVMPSHRSGIIMSGDPLYLAMPQLPATTPYPYSNEIDPETGVSMRMYYGHGLGNNTNGMIHDAIWGSTLAQEYAMAMLLPL